jgi:hypothetical protein
VFKITQLYPVVRDALKP